MHGQNTNYDQYPRQEITRPAPPMVFAEKRQRKAPYARARSHQQQREIIVLSDQSVHRHDARKMHGSHSSAPRQPGVKSTQPQA